jgi:hypothetical protein
MTITIIAVAAITAAAVSSITTTAKAQSGGGAIKNACPTGTISFDKGECTVLTQTKVSKVCPTVPGGTSQFDLRGVGTCTVTFPATSDTQQISQDRNTCGSLGGAFNDQLNPPVCSFVPSICPDGIGTPTTYTECTVTTTTEVRPGGR